MHFIISVNCTSKRQHSFCYTNLCLNRLLFLFYLGIFYLREENNKCTHRGLQNCRHSTMSVWLIFCISLPRVRAEPVVIFCCTKMATDWKVTEMNLPFSWLNGGWSATDIHLTVAIHLSFRNHSVTIQSAESGDVILWVSCRRDNLLNLIMKTSWFALNVTCEKKFVITYQYFFNLSSSWFGICWGLQEQMHIYLIRLPT